MTRSRTPASSRLHGIAPPEGKDRRLLRLCFAAAVLLHGGLLFLPVPWTDAAAAPEPPPRVVHVERLRDLRPPEPPEPVPPDAPTETPEPRVPIPVPDDLVDEKPPLDDAPLPAPDLDTLAEIPVILPDGPPPPAPPAPDEPVHVLGPIVPPEAVFAPRPDYPEPARRTHRGGTVILLATIDEEGRVTDLEILRGGPLGLTEAALAAVRRWRFRPATLEDRPIAVYYHLTVRFETR